MKIEYSRISVEEIIDVVPPCIGSNTLNTKIIPVTLMTIPLDVLESHWTYWSQHVTAQIKDFL